MTQVDIKGRQLSFSEKGQGPPVVCLHSGVPGATAAGDFAPAVEALSSNYRVILVDLPSFGGSAAVEDANVQSVSASVSALLSHLQVERASVIGNGLGGEVALNLAADAPEAVDRLVLIAPTGCRVSPFTPVPMEGLKAISAYRRQPSPERMTGVLRLLRPDPASVSQDEAAARHAAVAGGATEDTDTASTADRDPLLLAPQVQAPTLLLWGREDRFSPLDYALNLLARLPDARFHMLPRAGHNAQLDAAVEVNALLRDFLGGTA